MGRFSGLWGVVAAAGLLSACGSGGHGDMMMDGPDGMGGPGGTGMGAHAGLMSVSPPGGAVGVPTSTAITIRFGAPMAPGMEQWVDLHESDLAGPTAPMHCGWSPDATALTCTPDAPLHARTTYWLHVGGGMMTRDGQPLDYDGFGPGMGGHWILGDMMGAGSHAGDPWDQLPPGWRHAPNGAYGMAFAFTTA